MIPPPYKKIKNITELHTLMKTTHGAATAFTQFKKCVREKSAALNLNRRDRYSTPRRWDRLVKEVTELEPTLWKYKDQWPITAYHDLYIKKHLERRMSVKPKEIIELSSRENSPDQGPSFRSSSPSLPPRNRAANTLLSNIDRSLSPEYTVIAICNRCPFYEILKNMNSCNNGLKLLIKNSTTLEAFRKFGICFDQHLDYLIHHLDDTSRSTVLEFLPSNVLNASERSKLLQALKDYALRFRGFVGANANQGGIPCPSWATQEKMIKLVDHVKFNNWFRHVMFLEDEHDLFFQLLAVMEKHSVRLHQIMYPVVEHLRATIRLIITRYPQHFRRYINYWPIQLYIKRRRLLLGCPAPQYTPHDEEVAFIYVFNEDLSPDVVTSRFQSREIVSIEQVPCKHHSTVDISGVTVTYRMFCQRLGIAELLPTLVHIGLHTDADVNNFCKLGLAERAQVLINAGVNLCALQDYMLNRMCNQWRRHFGFSQV